MYVCACVCARACMCVCWSVDLSSCQTFSQESLKQTNEKPIRLAAGGGLHILPPDDLIAEVNITRCEFVFNAGLAGGAINTWGTSSVRLRLLHSFFLGNGAQVMCLLNCFACLSVHAILSLASLFS